MVQLKYKQCSSIMRQQPLTFSVSQSPTPLRVSPHTPRFLIGLFTLAFCSPLHLHKIPVQIDMRGHAVDYALYA